MSDEPNVDDLAFEEYLDAHPNLEAYANGACQPFRPYARILWHAACGWAREVQPKHPDDLTFWPLWRLE